jgi:hypothetical protein
MTINIIMKFLKKYPAQFIPLYLSQLVGKFQKKAESEHPLMGYE